MAYKSSIFITNVYFYHLWPSLRFYYFSKISKMRKKKKRYLKDYVFLYVMSNYLRKKFWWLITFFNELVLFFFSFFLSFFFLFNFFFAQKKSFFNLVICFFLCVIFEMRCYFVWFFSSCLCVTNEIFLSNICFILVVVVYVFSR